MSDKPKENKAQIEFHCYTDIAPECVYYKKRTDSKRCMFEMHLNCMSKVAQVNALTIKLKRLTGE